MKELALFEKNFQNHMKSWFRADNELNKASLYSLLNGGKRIRPLLSIAISKALGGNEKIATIAGSAIEMIHTYSLIHDDLPAMDNDDFRRGKPSCHKAFGEAIAILAGDSLLTEAPLFLLSMLEKEEVQPSLINLLIKNLMQESGANGMILGQVLDITLEKKDKSLMSREEKLKTVEEIHYFKTGRLLALAVRQGSLTCKNITPTQLNEVNKFGDNIGLVFQVIDDILDETCTFEELGKTPGKDLLMDKLTYPSIIGKDESLKYATKLLADAMQILNSFSTHDPTLAKTILNSLSSSIIPLNK